MQRGNLFFKQLIAFAIILSCLSTPFAQTKRGSSGTWKTTKQSVPKCAGGWSGVITYKKTLKDSFESDEPGIRKNIDRIKHKTSRAYDYTGRAVIDGTNLPNPLVTTNVSFTDNNLNWGQEKVFDTCNSRENGHWFIIEGTDDRQTQAQTSGPARSYYLNVDEMSGTYGFNLQFPFAAGIFKREQHVKRSGHCQPKNNEPYDKSDNEPTKIDGESFSVSGEKINPESPDVLTGTKVWGDDGKGQVRSFVYQVSWRFTRCPGQLVITDLKFEHPKFPDFEDWKEIPDVIGTIDGNKIKVKVKVLNMTGETKFAELKIKETYKGDKYNGSRADEPLPEAESSFRLEAGEEKEFEFIWDSEGQSWFDDGRPHLLHRLKAELAENGQKKDEKEKPLNIAPKPLVLVHGVWSNSEIWEPLYQNLLTANHSYNWKAFPVGNVGEGRMMMGNAAGDPAVSIYENAERLARYVKYSQTQSNAWHVDMVAHSTGGLVARLYLHKLMPVSPDARPLVKHLAMLGTPNGGIKCIDVFVGKLNLFKDYLQPFKEFTNDEMLNFNRYVVNTGGTKLSALVGNSVPVICGGYEWNDGFVTVNSAKYGVADFAYSNDLNLQLVDGKNFGNFVKPHVVTGPKGTYPLPVKSDPNDFDRWKINGSWLNSTNNYFANVSFGKNDELANNPQKFSKELELAPKQVSEIEIPVEAAQNFGVTFIANPQVSVSLINDKGVVINKVTPASPLSNSIFRMVFTNQPVAKSVWKLRIENGSQVEQFFAGFAWSSENLPTPKTNIAE